MGKPISFSLIVPVYSEHHNLVSNIANMDLKLREITNSGTISDYEIIVLWGIGGIKSRSLLNDLRRLKIRNVVIYENQYPELGIMFKRGISLARNEYVGLITPFNQVNLYSLKNILEYLNTHDMVVAFIGNRSARLWYRAVASEINTKLVNWLFGLNLKYYHLNFYRTALVRKVPFATNSHAVMVEAGVWMAKSGINFAQVPFEMIPHNFKSKSRAFRVTNIIKVFKAYAALFWQIRILGKRIDLN